MIPNLVPTTRARRLADTLIREAATDTGTDAVLNHLDHLDPEHVYAVLSVILDRYCHRPGRPRIARNEFTPDQRRAAHAAHARGERTPEVVAGEREYQRVKKREKREQMSTGGGLRTPVNQRDSVDRHETMEGSESSGPRGCSNTSSGALPTYQEVD